MSQSENESDRTVDGLLNVAAVGAQITEDPHPEYISTLCLQSVIVMPIFAPVGIGRDRLFTLLKSHRDTSPASHVALCCLNVLSWLRSKRGSRSTLLFCIIH